MSEEIKATPELTLPQVPPLAQGGTITAAPPAQTHPQAVIVDINSIVSQAETKASEAAEKKMEAVFKSMLQQQGLDAEAINTMTAEWKSKQVTPEQKIAQLQGELTAERGKITAYQQEKILRGHGLTDDEDIEIYSIRIGKLTADGKTFEQAAQEYFTAHPRSQKIPATATFGGTGKQPMTGNTLDDYKKMSSQEKIKLKQDNPTLYEQFKKSLGF